MPRLQETHVHFQWRVLFRSFCDVKLRAELCYCFKLFRVSVCFTILPHQPVIKGKSLEAAFVYRAFQRENVKFPHWQSEKKSVDAVYCWVVFSAADRVLKKHPTTKTFGCGSYVSGPLAGLHKSRRYRQDELIFVQLAWRHEILTLRQFFLGGGGNFCTFSVVKELRP